MRLTSSAPVYSTELAPPKLRGFFVGMNGINIALGYGLGTHDALATNIVIVLILA